MNSTHAPLTGPCPCCLHIWHALCHTCVPGCPALPVLAARRASLWSCPHSSSLPGLGCGLFLLSLVKAGLSCLPAVAHSTPSEDVHGINDGEPLLATLEHKQTPGRFCLVLPTRAPQGTNRACFLLTSPFSMNSEQANRCSWGYLGYVHQKQGHRGSRRPQGQEDTLVLKPRADRGQTSSLSAPANTPGMTLACLRLPRNCYQDLHRVFQPFSWSSRLLLS